MNKYGHTQSICFVIPHFVTFSTGGAEVQVYYLTRAFLKRGWKVEVVCAGRGHEKTIEQSPYLNPNIKYHYYKKKAIRLLEHYEVTKALKRTNSHYYYQRTDFALTYTTYKYAQKRNKTMVYALAGDSDAHKRKYSAAFKEFVYAGFVKKWVRKIDFFLLDKMIEFAKKKVDLVVFQNKYQQDTYLRNFKRSGGIVPNSFGAEGKYSVQKENVVLWCGNNNPVKRPELFVQLAREFTGVGNWEFVMVGGACNHVADKDLPANLNMLGSVSYDEANKWFAKAKIYINTSSVEGMPNTFIQSWYFKTLVLSLTVDPQRAFSKHKTGFSFNGDFDKLQVKLKELLESENNQVEIENGNRYFTSNFNLDANIDKLIQLMLENKK